MGRVTKQSSSTMARVHTHRPASHRLSNSRDRRNPCQYNSKTIKLMEEYRQDRFDCHVRAFLHRGPRNPVPPNLSSPSPCQIGEARDSLQAHKTTNRFPPRRIPHQGRFWQPRRTLTMRYRCTFRNIVPLHQHLRLPPRGILPPRSHQGTPPACSGELDKAFSLDHGTSVRRLNRLALHREGYPSGLVPGTSINLFAGQTSHLCIAYHRDLAARNREYRNSRRTRYDEKRVGRARSFAGRSCSGRA